MFRGKKFALLFYIVVTVTAQSSEVSGITTQSQDTDLLTEKFGDITKFFQEGVQMQCSPNEMCIAVSSLFYSRQGITDVSISNLRLNQNCGLNLVDENIAVLCTNGGLMSCGNVMSVTDRQKSKDGYNPSTGDYKSLNDTHVTYTNSLISHTIVDDNFPSVVFGSQWGEHEIEWDCAYPINYLSSLTSSYADDQFQYFQVRRLIIDHTLSGTGFGIFPIAMFLYRDENYDVIHPNPPALGMDQTLYLGISLIEGPMDAVIQVRECWATPTNNSEDQFTYGLIKNNCPALEAEHVQIDNAPLQRHFRWSSPVFRFTTSSRVYVHCYVSICFTNMQQCSKNDCQQRFRRRRSIDDVSKEQWNEEALLSVGPIFLDKDVENVNSNIFFDDVLKNNDADHYHDRDRATINWFFVVAVCVVMSIIICIVIILFIIRRKRNNQHSVET